VLVARAVSTVLERAGTMTVKSSLAAKRKRATVRQDGANITLRSSIKNETASRPAVKRVLVVGIGGTSVKILTGGKQKLDRFHPDQEKDTDMIGRLAAGVVLFASVLFVAAYSRGSIW